MEASPEKAPAQSSPRGADAGNAPSQIPPSDSLRLLDLDEESGESSPAAAAEVTAGATELAPLPPDDAQRSAPAGGQPAELSPSTESPDAPKTEAPGLASQVVTDDQPPQPARADEAPNDGTRNDADELKRSPVATQTAGSAARSPENRAVPKTPRTAAVQARLGVSPLADADPLDAMPSLRPSRPVGGGTEPQRTGHPVRDRLLAKATEANRSQEATSPIGETKGSFSALRGMEAELEQLAGSRPRLVSEPVRVGKAVLSPTATLVGITLIGLAAISSLFLLLAKFDPKGAPEGEPLGVAVPAPALPSLTLVEANAALSAALPPPVAPPERKREAGPWRMTNAEGGQRLIRGTVGSNPFLKAIEQAGIDKSQAYRVYGALKEHKDLDHCRPKDEFVAIVNRADKRVVAFEYIVSKEEVYQAREKDGKLTGKLLDLKVSKHRVQGSLLLTQAGFSAAVQNAGLETSIGDVINRALSGHTNVSQFRAGDRLRVVAQEVTVLGEFHRYAGIEALEYVPVEGDPVRIYYHAAKRQYYDAKGRAPGEGGWRSPVRGAPITSKFNPQRMHPILKKKMPHTGTDFGAPAGTPIYAASYGKITKLGNYGANGNYIAIEHDNGYETGYSHLSRFEPGVKVNDTVKRSQVIGYVGSTGRSTGPHLHFSARKNGAYIDPETLHLDALTVLPTAERAVFQGVKEKYDALLEAVALPPPLPPQLTAPAPVPAAPAEEMDDEGMDLPGQVAPPAPVPAVPPAAQPQVPLNAPGSPLVGAPQAAPIMTQPVSPAAGGAFFLSDKDLLQNQPAVDDGEVDQ